MGTRPGKVSESLRAPDRKGKFESDVIGKPLEEVEDADEETSGGANEATSDDLIG